MTSNAPSSNEFIRNVSSIRHTLLTLKQDHESTMTSIEKNIETEKSSRGSNTLEEIELGLDEADILFSLGTYLQLIEAERLKWRIQVHRLYEENAWLKEELTRSQTKLQVSERCSFALEEENKQLRREADTTEDIAVPDEETAHSLDVSSTARLQTLQNLVIQYANQGRYEVAVPLCKQALKDMESHSGHENLDVASMLNVLALMYRNQGKYNDAASLLNDALKIRERTLGPEHATVAATLNNLAVLHGKRRQFKEAEQLCIQALLIREKSLGPDHPDVAKQLNNLAVLCKNQAKYEQVELYYTRALEIYTSCLGQDDKNVANTKNNLAAVYLKQGKYQEAETLYKDILTRAHESEYGPQTQSIRPICWQMAEECQQQKSKCENRRRRRSSYTRPNIEFGTLLSKPENQVLACVLKNLAALYRRQGKHEAGEMLEEWSTRVNKARLRMESQTI